MRFVMFTDKQGSTELISRDSILDQPGVRIVSIGLKFL